MLSKCHTTEHRVIQKTALLRAIAFAFLFPALFAPAAAGLDLDSLLVASAGGKVAVERLRTMHSLYFKGDANLFGQPGSFATYFKAPDRIYIEMDMGAYSVAQGYDGTTAWQRDYNGTVSELSGYEREELISQVYLLSYSYLFDDRLPGGKEYLGLTEREGVPYHKVGVYPLYRDTVYMLLDTATARQVYNIGAMDNSETVTLNDDYHTVEGVPTPFLTKTTVTGIPLPA